MENMKEVLKKTRKVKHKKSRQHRRHAEIDTNGISEILSKKWQFSSPPSAANQPEEASSSKINAFERMMTKKPEPFAQISPEINGVKKKRKYVKKPKHNKLDAENDSDESAQRENSETTPVVNGIHKFLNGSTSTSVPKDDEEDKSDDEPLSRKRSRVVDTPLKVVDNITKKRKTKTEKVLLDSNENSFDTPSKVILEHEVETPTYQSGRPRRSCAAKISYEHLISPEKLPESLDKRNARSKAVKKIDDDYIDTLLVEDESPVRDAKQKKLAPLFMKKVPKPSIDPAVKEARRNFLLSGLPEDLRNSIDKQKQFEDEIVSNELIAFPLVSHITQQLNSDECRAITEDLWQKSRVKIRSEHDCDEAKPQVLLSCGSLTDCRADKIIPVVCDAIGLVEREPLEHVKALVKGMKEVFGNFPTNRCFKQLHWKRKNAKVNDANRDNDVNEETSMFFDIFKPIKFDEFLINTKPVKDLQKFLLTWNDKESDDYDSEESDTRQSSRAMNNFVVLSGRNGCGKTSSVFALAADLNYQVIETNASSRRSGKIMLQDLLEATQSHRVKNKSSRLNDVENSQETTSDTADGSKTIILIEDAELAFESDDGFASSLQQLINISKRPVVLTTNSRSCQHLQRFIQHNEIVYDEPNAQHITQYLSLLCLAANYQINATAIEHLCALNGHDLRKTINEIEFFIRSSNARTSDGDLMELYRRPRREWLTRGQLNCVNKTLSTLCFESSIASSFVAASGARVDGSEISHQRRDLMDEMADFFVGEGQSNLVEIRRDLAHGNQKVIER